jgi:hypothetical protein
VVVEDGRAPRERELGQPGPRGGVLGLGVDLRPHRVELAQPLEERRLLGPGPRQRLIQVVVGVDEPRGDDRAGQVDPLVGCGRLAVSERLNDTVPLEQPPVRQLRPGVVGRVDPPVVKEPEQRAREPIPFAPTAL